MKRSTLIAIFATAGIAFTGSATTDALALAGALSSQNRDALQRFVVEFADSIYVPDAVLLLAEAEQTPSCGMFFDGTVWRFMGTCAGGSEGPAGGPPHAGQSGEGA